MTPSRRAPCRRSLSDPGLLTISEQPLVRDLRVNRRRHLRTSRRRRVDIDLLPRRCRVRRDRLRRGCRRDGSPSSSIRPSTSASTRPATCSQRLPRLRRRAGLRLRRARPRHGHDRSSRAPTTSSSTPDDRAAIRKRPRCDKNLRTRSSKSCADVGSSRTCQRAPLTSTRRCIGAEANTQTLPLAASFVNTEFGMVWPRAKLRLLAFGCG